MRVRVVKVMTRMIVVCRMNVTVYSSELAAVIQGVVVVSPCSSSQRMRASQSAFAANKQLSAGRAEPPADP